MNKQIVPSGTSIVGGKEEKILEAYLGSCVGVTLVDRRAEVGGLLHLLLAEAPGSDRHFNPENYATSGMPHFLNKPGGLHGWRRSYRPGIRRGSVT